MPTRSPQGIPPDVLARANAQSQRLRALVRAPEILVMPGAHDVLSAQIYERLGFKAIQGSSGGIAAADGYPDGEVIPFERTVEATARIAEAVSVPVNADGEKGYADAAHIGDTIKAFIRAGAAGMNLEDSAHPVPGQPRGLVPLEQFLKKVAAVMDTKKAVGSEFFLNARVDAFLIIRHDPPAALREGIRRGQAYAEAGADCIFFMATPEPEVIRTLVREIPAPVSVLAGAHHPSVREMQELGVARVSYGTAFARVAAGAIRRLAAEIMEKGTVSSLEADAIPLDYGRARD